MEILATQESVAKLNLQMVISKLVQTKVQHCNKAPIASTFRKKTMFFYFTYNCKLQELIVGVLMVSLCHNNSALSNFE